MPLRSLRTRRPFGIATVVAVSAIALVVIAGVVLSGTPTTPSGVGAHGVIERYAAEPHDAWTLDDTDLPGVVGGGNVKVVATHGNDWLIAYPAGIKRKFVLVDARSGRTLWRDPVDAGFGDCGIADSGTIGCAVRLRIDGPENGFYLVDRNSGHLTRVADGDDSATVVGFGRDFVHVNQSGYQVSMRSPDGDIRWSRTFPGAATVTAAHDVLIVTTSDGAGFIVDPRTGADQLTCAQCSVDAFQTGITVTTTASGAEAVAFYRYASDVGIVKKPTGIAQRSRLVRGPSTFPVIAPAGEGSSLEAAGRYEIIDPETGKARWAVADRDLSKAGARPCGDVISVARKDRSRVFFDLADGTRRGSLPPPALDRPDANLDVATCLGASDAVAVFVTPNQLTAYGIDSGSEEWTHPLLGTADTVDGRIVLRQGSTLTALRPNQ